MPPFSPWQRIPRPAPTAPSAKSALQSARAAATCASVTCRPRISFRPLSLHSQTTGFTLPVVSQISGVALQHIFDQRRFHGAHTQGVGKQDGGLQRAQLIDLDKAGGLAEAVDDMAGRQHFVMEHIPGWGSSAVTPVWISPSASVQWPTVRPAHH